MKYFSRSTLAFSLLILFAAPQSNAQEVTISTVHREPFVFMDEDRFSGFSIDLWEYIVADNNWSYAVAPAGDYVELLRSAREGVVDAAVADIAITPEREELMVFSDPIFEGGLQIVVVDKSSWGLLFDALTLEQGVALLVLLLGVFLTLGFMMWLSERHDHRRIRSTVVPGLGDALWWMATLGGFGRALPVTLFGRFILMLWMFVVTVCLALYVSVVMTSLGSSDALRSIGSYHDLSNKKVGVIKNSIADAFMRDQQIEVLTYRTAEDLFFDLEMDFIDAAVHNVPTIRYFKEHEIFTRDIMTAGPVFERDLYGFALPQSTLYVEQINKSLAKLRADGTYDALYRKWFGFSN